ncbi:hypothetical protein ACDQ55_08145 [Chitinophaga sp. 30R24]|uniref:hypothetical protein n=1 Tax=Chitinophaga sp. 30R24 TaxID=3248838 RepID=UPI003B8F3250
MNFLGRNETYTVSKTEGLEQDIKKIYFLLPDCYIKKDTIVIKYINAIEKLYILSDSVPIASYQLEKINGGLFINNFIPVIQELSFNDLNARRYKIDPIKYSGETLEILISNGGNSVVENDLVRPVVLSLSK